MNYADSPIFIIGSERSGTNLVRKRLTQSQSIYLGPSPAHFLKHLYYQQPYYNDLNKDTNFLKFLQQSIDLCVVHFSPWDINWIAEDLLIEFSEQERSSISVMHFMMNKYAAEHGYSGYICKDNYLYEFALDIERFLPNAKFIYLYRDPRDYVLSQLKRPESINSVFRFSILWSYEQTKSIMVANQLSKIGKCVFLGYEEFIENEEIKLIELLSFMKVNRSKDSGYQDLVKEEIHDWKNINSSTKKDNFNKFLNELSPRKIKNIERDCYLQMNYLGYEPLFYDGKKNSKLIKFLDYLYSYFTYKFIFRKSKSQVIIHQHKVCSRVIVNYRSDKI